MKIRNIFFTLQAAQALNNLEDYEKSKALKAISKFQDMCTSKIKGELLQIQNSIYYKVRILRPGIRIALTIAKEDLTIIAIKADREIYNDVENKIGNI